MNYYCAVKTPRGWTVGTIHLVTMSTRPHGEMRTFETFDEANEVAKDIAAGKYPWLADRGEFVNMR